MYVRPLEVCVRRLWVRSTLVVFYRGLCASSMGSGANPRFFFYEAVVVVGGVWCVETAGARAAFDARDRRYASVFVVLAPIGLG